MDSINDLPPSQLICPMVRIEKLTSRIYIRYTSITVIDNLYYLHDDARENTKNSSHLHHLKLLPWCNNEEGKENDFKCAACSQNTIGTIYYHCDRCDEHYHKECVESPTIFISPYHPKYRLKLLRHVDGECHSCGKITTGFVYYSSLCGLLLHPVCANKREFPPINNPKRHEHTLHYFPRIASLTCDVCGTYDDKVCFYICHQCNFVVHIKCVDLPRVIQISRHDHRLFFTYTLSFEKWVSCGVCRLSVERDYGAYACSKGCTYAVHCKCAIQKDIWDGRELEDEPENIYDDIKSYEEIGDGIIRHFSHQEHHMRFDKDMYEMYNNENKYCEACKLPLFDGGNSYRCMECDFYLHEACANLPRTKQIMVHAHQFVLRVDDLKRDFFCESCHRYSYGFRYQCSKCYTFNVDVRCASLSEPIHHKYHRHPLFLRFYTRRDTETCSVCGERSSKLLNCDERCRIFTLCFACATLPYKFKHENDEHFLTLSYEDGAGFLYLCNLCELCEEKIDRGHYSCSECATKFHIRCVLGNDPYMNPGQLVTFLQQKIDIFPNNRLNRPFCNGCKRHCQYKKILFKRGGNIYCSYSEILDSILVDHGFNTSSKLIVRAMEDMKDERVTRTLSTIG